MSQIDLKYATIYIEDGYTGPAGASGALVNNGAGYSAAAVTMAVNGITGAVVTGDRFTVAGDDVVHTITAHSETLGNTTSITFTPGLGDAVADDAVITWQPHQLEVNIGEGNCTYDESRNMQYKLNRGNLDTVREGDQAPMDVKIDANWEFLRSSSGDPPTIEEALKKVGAASTWVSSSDDACEPYAVNVIIDYIPPCGDVQSERIILPDYRWEKLSHDPKAGTISTSGKCNAVQASVARYDQA